MVSKTWVFWENEWHKGDVPIMGPRTHSTWLGSSVFDGGRFFEGVAPDLDLHFRRVNDSAERMYLRPEVSVERWVELAWEGINRFDKDAALYIRPMYWAQDNGMLAIAPDPESTRWCLAIYEVPLPPPTGFSMTLSPLRRPTIETAPVDVKAGCLYPNSARAVFEAKRRGFDNCIVCDVLGNVAELANSNIFMAKDGVVFTPAGNGTFLAGITRNRVIDVLRRDGVEVIETILRYRDFEQADEIFSTGNFAKVLPVNRIDDRSIQPGPLYQRARDAYWAFAHANGAHARPQ
jgi:branched-chain amino acid aminotransferase